MVARYPRAYAILHWLIAALIFVLFAMQYVRRLFGEDAHAIVREWHKSLGLVLVALIVVRLVVRLVETMPPRFPDPSRLRTFGAHLVHAILWGLMIVVPFLGVAFLIARGRGVNFFTTMQIGPFTSGSAYWGDITINLHRYSAYALIAVIVLHAAAAFYHRIILKDDLLSRMAVASSSVDEKNQLVF
ncbi:cytochrome b [Shinella sp.]|uniref:cytochrome b n=1 Tax=Shinella sp. TaxID=1870904 RepID=UPI003F702923